MCVPKVDNKFLIKFKAHSDYIPIFFLFFFYFFHLRFAHDILRLLKGLETFIDVPTKYVYILSFKKLPESGPANGTKYIMYFEIEKNSTKRRRSYLCRFHIQM